MERVREGVENWDVKPLVQSRAGSGNWKYHNGTILLALSCSLLCALSASLLAQTAQFLGGQTTAVAGLTGPVFVAVDRTGNLYVANSSGQRLVKVPAGGGAPIPISLPNNDGVTAVAVDSSNNVYVGLSDSQNGLVIKIPANGGTSTQLGSGWGSPSGIAVDSSGDVFVADNYLNQVFELPSGGGQVAVNFGNLEILGDIAVDGAGNLFVPNGFEIAELPVGASTPITFSIPHYVVAVAVDAAGNVFATLEDTSLPAGEVVELPAGGGSAIPLGITGINYPVGITVDSAGNVFVADYLNNRVVELGTRTVNFGPTNVCPIGQQGSLPCTTTVNLIYSIPAGADLGTANVLTLGASNIDFFLASFSTCTGSLAAGSECTVPVEFAPNYAGLRSGVVNLTDDLGNVVASTNISGLGIGPEIAFTPSKQSSVGSGFISPVAVTVDGSGDVYVADSTSNQVYKIPAGGGTKTIVGAGLKGPTGIAVDGGGDVFVADELNGRVVKVPAGDGTQTTVGTGLSSPAGVALDGLGDVFIADSGHNSVVKVPASGNGPQTTIGTGLVAPKAVAVDPAGDVFIADSGNGRVVEVPSSGGPQFTVVSGLQSPPGLAVDPAGNVYIADYGNNRVLEIMGVASTYTVLGTGLDHPSGVALDGAGNVFIADTGNARVVELPRSQAPALNFASTDVGKTSTDSAQLVGVENIGNQPLSLTKVSYPADFPESSSLGSGETACQGNSSLAVGGACYLAVNFSPLRAGALSENLTLTDNSLNAVSATQSIALSGTGIGANTPAALTAPTSSVLPGPSATFSWSSQTGAAGYWLFIGTTGVGSKDLYDSGETTATSITYGALPLTGATIYVRLYTSYSGTLVHNDYKFTAARSAVLASPAPGGTLPGPSATFTWSAATGTGVQGYWLFLGTSGKGSKNLYDSGEITGTSVTVSGLPLTGATIYARVYTSYNGTLEYNDYTYAAAKLAVLTSPAPGGTLPGPSATFAWSAATGTGVQGYWLFLGTSGAGSKNLYDSGEITGTSVTVSSLPLTGATIYARVYTSYNGTLEYNDYTYAAAKLAVLTSPAPGGTLPGPSATFAWSAATGTGVQGYWLFLGTSGKGSKNLYDSGEITGTSVTVSSLPLTGATIYARVYTSYNGTLEYNDYTFTSAQQAKLTMPAPGSTLQGSSATFDWSAATGSGAQGYWLFLGTTGAGSKNLYDSGQTTATSVKVSGLPTNAGATIYARLYTSYGGKLEYLDYIYMEQ